MNAKEEFKIVERLFFFALLMFVGGFYGGYTYSLRGKVFANAQTANLVMMMLSFGNGDWKRGLYSFVPLTAYICGGCFAELLGERLNRKNGLRADSASFRSVYITPYRIYAGDGSGSDSAGHAQFYLCYAVYGI